ncbi:MAG: glycosyltransferase [Kiritimatiellia bacterium]
MRVIFVHNGADLYGASRSFLRLCSRMVRDGITVRAVLPESGPLLDALRDAGVDVLVLHPLPLIERRAFRSLSGIIKTIWCTPVSVWRLRGVIRDFQPDLVHSNLSVLYTPAIAARWMRIPHVWHIRECYGEFGAFWKIYRRFMLWGSDRILAVSQAVADQFGAQGAGRVMVLHNGFPIEEFDAVPVARQRAFRDRVGVRDEPLVGLVGRIKFVRKGQEYLAEAAALLKDRFPDVRYVLVGSAFPGNEAHVDALRERIAALGVGDRVLLAGDVEDIKAAYAAMDIVVMASGLPEPFGGVVIEAMAMGKPVVGSAMGGTLEQVVDGVTGLLVPPRDPVALAKALARLLENEELRQRMGAAGRKHFEQHFAFGPFYDALRALYREVTCGC